MSGIVSSHNDTVPLNIIHCVRLSTSKVASCCQKALQLMCLFQIHIATISGSNSSLKGRRKKSGKKSGKWFWGHWYLLFPTFRIAFVFAASRRWHLICHGLCSVPELTHLMSECVCSILGVTSLMVFAAVSQRHLSFSIVFASILEVTPLVLYNVCNILGLTSLMFV